MESVGAFSCSESMDSFAVSEFLNHSLFQDGQGDDFSPSLEAETSVATTLNESLACSLHNPEFNLGNVSQQCSHYSSNATDRTLSYRDAPTCFLSAFNQIQSDNNVFLPTGMFMGIANPNVAAMSSDIGVEESDCMRNDRANAVKRKFNVLEKNIVDPSENIAKKRIWVPRDVGSEGQSSCSYSSEEENVGQETKPCSATNSNGKARAARGGATDPQSLYARKRRERINERLRILQNLVPNGTKVDISTMLEEAVHYVKFLQLQIKLLSSDDMWMYAPLAYNGFDMGLHMKIFSKFTPQ